MNVRFYLSYDFKIFLCNYVFGVKTSKFCQKCATLLWETFSNVTFNN